MPFGTLFSSLTALDQEIKRSAVDISKKLRQVENCQEWSIEGMLDRKQAVDCLLAEGIQSGRFSLPEAVGRRHLQEQKLRRELVLALDDWLDQCLAPVQHELEGLSRDYRPRRLRDEIILHWAYLVTLDQVEAFTQTLNALAHRYEPYGLQFRMTGPWPPYTFCQISP